MTETSLLTFEERSQRFEFSIAGSCDSLASAAVVYQGVDSLLQHSLFVSHDDVGRAELNELFKSVVTVDNSAIQIVEIRRSVSAAVKRYHRTKFRRKYGKYVQYHPLGSVAAYSKRFDDVKTFYRLGPLCAVSLIRIVGNDGFELCRFLFKVDIGKQLFDSLCAHTYSERAKSELSVSLLDLCKLFILDHVFVMHVGSARIEYYVFVEIKHKVYVLWRHI